MKFIVCTDGSDYGGKAVKFAAEYCKGYKADLTILHVVEVVYPVAEEQLSNDPAFEAKKEEAEAILSRARKLAEEVSKDTNYDERIAWGSIASEIVRIAENEEYDGIAIGTKGVRGVKRMMLGSVADNVIRHAHCPVAVVR